MRTKIFITVLGAIFLTYTGPALAQPAKKMPRVGYLCAQNCRENNGDAFRQGLRELGYVEGKNIIVEFRYAEGRLDRVRQNAADLVRSNVDVIVTGGSADTLAAKESTKTIPIVMSQDSDPVGSGFIASLAHPGGNITGLASLSSELTAKLLELVKDALPRVSSVTVLRGPGPGNARIPRDLESIAQSLGMKVQFSEIKQPDDLNPALDAIAKANISALVVTGGPFATGQRKQIVEFASKDRIPAAYYRSEFVNGGGLMSYSPNRDDLARRAAIYVDKILRGAKPADLPVEQPMKFQLVINLKTAKQIGLTIPPNVLARADKVIK
jgi:putative ABC transport system substrate-binding protein